MRPAKPEPDRLAGIDPIRRFARRRVSERPRSPALLSELFSTRVGGFFGLDVFVSAVVLLVFVAVEGRRTAAKHRWLSAAVTLACGVSAGFPLFL